MRLKFFARSIALVAAAAIIAACGSGTQSSGPRPAAGGTVNVRISGDWGNPIDAGHSVTTAIGGGIAESMYDRLVDFDYKTGSIVPYLASSWKVTPNSVAFKLRSDASCSDGTPVTPTVVYNSMAHLISPQLASKWPVTIFGNATPYTMSKDDAAGTFTFTVPNPFNVLLQGFASYFSSIMCPAGLQAGANYDKQSYGSGPFIFQSDTHGSDFIVTKRKGWKWGPYGASTDKPGVPDTIDFKVIANETTAANLLLTGGLDIATVGGADATRLRSESSLSHTYAPSFAPYTLQINEDPTRPGSDQTVRQAMLTSLDAKAWNQAALGGSGIVSTNFQSNPGGYCYADLSSIMPKASPSAAKQVLLNAGWTAGPDGHLQKNGKPLTVQILGSTTTAGGPEYIQSQLEQAGMKTVLSNVDYNTFAGEFGRTNYDIVVGLFGSVTPTPPASPNFFTGKFPPAGSNRIRRDDPQLAQIIANLFSAAPGAQACAAWKEYNTYMIKNWITFPWVAQQTDWFAKKGTFNYVPVGPTLEIPTLLRLK